MKIGFFKAKWYDVYNFIEFVMRYPKQIVRTVSYDIRRQATAFEERVNRALYDEGSAFSVKDREIVKRLGELEYSEIEAVLDLPTKYNTTGMHIKKSYDFFVSRDPDYENSVKEAVSALESLLKIMTGLEKSNMADLLTEYAKKNHLHPALRKALSNLFGFASDHEGIRHGGSVSAGVSEETARLVLMVCASACNFLAHPQQSADEISA